MKIAFIYDVYPWIKAEKRIYEMAKGLADKVMFAGSGLNGRSQQNILG